MGLGGGGAQAVGVRQPLVLGAQLGVLAGLGVDRLDLLEAVPEHVDLAGAVAGLAAQVGPARAAAWWQSS